MSQSNTNKPESMNEFAKFKALTKKLVTVPKKDIQEREAKEKAGKVKDAKKSF